MLHSVSISLSGRPGHIYEKQDKAWEDIGSKTIKNISIAITVCIICLDAFINEQI